MGSMPMPTTPEDAQIFLDEFITTVEHLPAVLPTPLAIALFKGVTDAELTVRGVGIDLLSDLRNVAVAPQISLALADLDQAGAALRSGGGKSRFFTSTTLAAARQAGAPTVAVAGYPRLLADDLKAARRALSSLQAMESFRPRFLTVAAKFFAPLIAAHDAVESFRTTLAILPGAVDEVEKSARAVASTTGWIKLAAGAVVAAAGIGLAVFLSRRGRARGRALSGGAATRCQAGFVHGERGAHPAVAVALVPDTKHPAADGHIYKKQIRVCAACKAYAEKHKWAVVPLP